MRRAAVPASVLRGMMATANQDSTMSGDSNSNIAWHRVQLKKNRDALKDMETKRFAIGEIASSGRTESTIADLKRKIGESERCIAAYERQTRRPVATDFHSLTSVTWGSWNARGGLR